MPHRLGHLPSLQTLVLLWVIAFVPKLYAQAPDPSDPGDTTHSVGSAEPAPTETTETNETAETTEPAESAGPTEVAEPAEITASAEIAEPGEMTDADPVAESPGVDDEAQVPGPFEIAGVSAQPGSRAQFMLRSSEDFLTGAIHTWGEIVRGDQPGPVLCLTGGVHGDELNGVEIVRRVLESVDPAKLRGVVIGVPIVNPFGFVNQSRYLPDRRDLNRFFPGRTEGSMASRVAWELWSKVIVRCTHLIDLHTGSQNRTNQPQIRGNLDMPAVMDMARAFDAPVVIHNPGQNGTLRGSAARSGIPAVLYEAGETLRFQPEEVERGVLGIRNVMRALGMRRGRAANLGAQHVFTQTRWLRADRGGILELKVKLGDTVSTNQVIGVISDPLRRTRGDFVSRRRGRVIGLSLLPMVVPGMAVVHVGVTGQVLDAVEADEEMDLDRPE